MQRQQGEIRGKMAHQVEYSTASYKTPLHHRITASMPVKASWYDKATGETINVEGLTENVGETTALVNKKTIIDVQTQVIRVERDPSKPMAALSVLENLKKWKTTAMRAAQEWVTRHWQLNYEEEWVN
jgi:hypothetical protein